MNNFHPVPKPPKDKKKKKKQNGWKDKPNRYCFYCGAPNAERHETFGGNPNRQISIDHGFQVDVCRSHHEELEKNITEWAIEQNLYWEQHWQRDYEGTLIVTGITPKQARDCWMKLIGKNNLEIIEEG